MEAQRYARDRGRREVLEAATKQWGYRRFIPGLES